MLQEDEGAECVRNSDAIYAICVAFGSLDMLLLGIVALVIQTMRRYSFGVN